MRVSRRQWKKFETEKDFISSLKVELAISILSPTLKKVEFHQLLTHFSEGSRISFVSFCYIFQELLRLRKIFTHFWGFSHAFLVSCSAFFCSFSRIFHKFMTHFRKLHINFLAMSPTVFSSLSRIFQQFLRYFSEVSNTFF